MNAKTYSTLNQEIVALAAVWDLIGSMVHYSHFVKSDQLDNVILKFHTREASKLFLIILADFLSVPRDGTLGLPRLTAAGALGKTYLGHLQSVVNTPQFAGDTTLLASSVQAFTTWLDGIVSVDKVWLPSIKRDGTLRVRRSTYLKICGTASKHGFTRLGDIVQKIRNVLAENGTSIDEGQGYLVIPDFQDWFQDHVFLASSTSIAWHLNEIRWGIYQYLSSEYQRAHRLTKSVGAGHYLYTYDAPSMLTDRLVTSMYWDLMNGVRMPPYFARFTVDPYIRDHF